MKNDKLQFEQVNWRGEMRHRPHTHNYLRLAYHRHPINWRLARLASTGSTIMPSPPSTGGKMRPGPAPIVVSLFCEITGASAD